MKEKEKQLYKAVAEHNVTPERYGDLALQDTIEFEPIPENVVRLPLTTEMYDRPDLSA